MLKKTVMVLTALGAVAVANGPVAGPAAAMQQRGCFAGTDHTGGPATLRLASEKFGNSFEITGTLHSSAVGSIRLKADGWSGAGRIFRGHEFESGAVYIQFSNYTGSSFVLSVSGYGRFPFRRVRC